MSQPSLIGKKLDEYLLEEKLGEGGMASVYRAVDVRLNRYVAVKVIRTAMRDDTEYSMRFKREAQAIAQLDHPNIITLYRFGETDGLLYMAMQYIDGADLAAVIESFQHDGDYIEFKEIVRVAHEIGAALDYAHAQGVIHRDIKPHNVMINQGGQALVTDFGLALITEIGTHGEIFGSPHYIPPEQAISSAGVVPQSDLYAMGVILYEMLTGTVPFTALTPLDIAMKHMSEPVPSPRQHRPELTEQVEAVLFKALAKEPSDRYATGHQLAQALEDALHNNSRPSRMTITSKVALEREAHPLPPIPAVTPPSTQLHQAPATQVASQDVTTQTRPERRSRLPMLALVGLVGVLAILLLVIFQITSNDEGDPEPTLAVAVVDSPTVTLTPTNTATQIPTQTATLTLIPSATQTFTPIPTSTSIPTSIPTAFFSPTPDPNNVLFLTSGIGLTTGGSMTNGEFEVEGYCRILNTNFGVSEDSLYWYCTQNGSVVRTLIKADFDEICRRTYNDSNAAAIQIPGTQPAAYRWRCYAESIIPSVFSYTLLIQWDDDHSLFVTNISNNLEFPISRLAMQGDGEVSGGEWGVDFLANNECVAVWKDRGNARAANSSCTLVGNRVERGGSDRFWKSDFAVLFDSIEIATCDANPCIVEITG